MHTHMIEGVPRNALAGNALVRVLQLASAASPVGSYAYSEALEYAVHCGDVDDDVSARAWIGGLLVHSVCALDVPMLTRMYRAWARDDLDAALDASAWMIACRETSELRAADRSQGQALVRVLDPFGITDAEPLYNDARVSYACAFALACCRIGIPCGAACIAYAYAWLENMVLAAIKLVPLGHVAGQRIVFSLAEDLPQRCALGEAFDEDAIAAGAPGQAIASAAHEIQATRLFRS